MSLVIILFVMSIGWILTSDSYTEFTSALQVGIAVWLYAHAVPLGTATMTLSIPPLVLTLLMLLMMRRAMKWAVRSTIITNPAGMLLLIASMAGSYAVIALGLSVMVSSGLLVNASRLLIATFGWAVLAGVWGIAKSPGQAGPTNKRVFITSTERTQRRIRALAPHDVLIEMWNALSVTLRLSVVTALRSLALTGVFAAIFALVILITRFSEIVAVISILSNQLPSQLAVVALTILYLPTVVVWYASLLIGPGFVVGGGSAITLITQLVGPLPALPFLAAIPTQLPWAVRLLLVVPALSAFVVSSRAIKRVHFVTFVATTSLVAGLMMMWFGILTSGAMGSGRFENVGSSPLQLLLWTTLWTAVGLVVRGALSGLVNLPQRASKETDAAD
jgi:hypothetical protein